MYKSLIALLALFSLAFAQDAEQPVAEAPQAETKPNPVVIIKTSEGDIEVELFVQQAPKTVKNFLDLAEGKREFKDSKTGEMVTRPFYDGLVYHRVIKDFMIQGGCPNGNGMGGPGYQFEDEINAKSLGLDELKALQEDGSPHPYLGIQSQQQFQSAVLGPLLKKLGVESQEQLDARMSEVESALTALTIGEAYANQGYVYNDELESTPPNRGVIAMANSGPNTNGSQFFINLIDTPWLTGKHTVFGKVIKGMDVVDKIGLVEVDPRSSKPKEDVTVISIRRKPLDAAVPATEGE
jgi:cyclophilin family peptidyl-prolyl cis-trans isomerase